MELNSLSKSFNMSGWRVGMLLGSLENVSRVLKVKSNMDSGMFYGLQKGAIAALNLDKSWFEKLNIIYTKRRELIWKIADILNCTYDKNSKGLFVWAKLPDEIKDSEKFIDYLLNEKKIFVAPGTIFGSEGEGYIRFSLCIDENNIIEAFKKIRKMKIGIIGLGLMGGSFALDIKAPFPSSIIHGIDNSAENLNKAKEIGLIDFIISYKDLRKMDLILVAVPVSHSLNIIPKVLDLISSNTLVFDVGSTKQAICELLNDHLKRGNYLAAHPMAGTEFSGPEAAQKGLYVGKTNIICEFEKTDIKLRKLALKIFNNLEMKTIYMDPKSHDIHVAYVSHLSHISSFMLGKTVIEKEENENNIFDLAGSGFESTVRLAKSLPETWTPIFFTK